MTSDKLMQLGCRNRQNPLRSTQNRRDYLSFTMWINAPRDRESNNCEGKLFSTPLLQKDRWRVGFLIQPETFIFLPKDQAHIKPQPSLVLYTQLLRDGLATHS